MLAFFMLAGCKTIPPEPGSEIQSKEQLKYELEYIDSVDCIALLTQLGLNELENVPDTNEIIVTGSPEKLQIAKLILDLIDTHDEYCIENLGPVSIARTLPSNVRIASALDNIQIGTFNDPPQGNDTVHAVIDIHGESVLAIIPTNYRQQLRDFLKQYDNEKELTISIPDSDKDKDKDKELLLIDDTTAQTGTESQSSQLKSGLEETTLSESREPETSIESHTDDRFNRQNIYSSESKTVLALSEMGYSNDSQSREPAAAAATPAIYQENTDEPKTLRITIKSASDVNNSPETTVISEAVRLQNGDDILDMALPETMTLMELLDLAGKHMGLNYVYAPGTIGKQSVAMKMHGSLQGEMKVRDLYTILETVLKFNDLAMIRREDKLVTIVPINEVLDSDPQFVDFTNKIIQAGDTVITRVYELRYVDVTSVKNLLQTMKLGVAVSPLEEANMLFITCYAHRMSRIEQLVSMLDRPGRPRECRFRKVQFVTAPLLMAQVRTLAQELRGIPITTTSTGKSAKQAKAAGGLRGAETPVYLDTDERTNRLLMIGQEQQLTLIEELIDVLDVVKEDLRIPKTYNIRHMTADEALGKLNQMEVLKASASPPKEGNVSSEEPIVLVMEATNQLLIKATRQQHVRIEETLGYIDISQEDLRTLFVYEIQHVSADMIKRKLEELNLIGLGTGAPLKITTDEAASQSQASNTSTAEILIQKPEVVVNETTNALFIKATAEQHEQIATIIEYIDSEMPEEELSYEIYPLENSSPEHVAGLLGRLVQQTANSEGKIENPVKRQEEITIVPDPNTFSLIVHASKKNQQWIGDLTKSLDKRRPQVLIDVTLVEITRTDTFEYDLNLVANAKDAVTGNIGVDPLHTIDSKAHLEGGFNLLDKNGNPTGQTKAFFSDNKVQALLTAIKRKNYGRVLAKPKIMVDDGQQGQISTTDKTTYVKEAIQVPDQGGPITTRDFESIEAKIQLQITPHISEGDLLRLDVHLSRDDFGTRPQEGAPPDTATSEVDTTVFVPDNHTVILGGLVKLNQSKGGSKVPILGDIPLVGALFRSVDNSNIEKKLYVFLKANIVRPSQEAGLGDLQKISDEHQKAFEEYEGQFQKHENIPGIKPKPMQPESVLKGYK
jgi:type II secretory pathway component GspD/PulD (secretin)